MTASSEPSPGQGPTGSVGAVCITMSVQARTASSTAQTGINKGAVEAIVVTPTGVEGDRVLDARHHGGVDKAVYTYAQADVDWWVGELGIEIPPGRFGENLRTEGIDVTGAVIGERWHIGDQVLVEVSEPRIPCATFQHHMDDRTGWVRQFTDAGMPGTYLRVLAEGEVRPGDPITVGHRPAHGVSIGRWYTQPDTDAARALLDAESRDWQMGSALRTHVDHIMSRER